MNKIYTLLVFLFTFGLSFSQEELSQEEKERRQKNIEAGNPFAKFGYKAKVATLSNGKYLEFHDLDSIVTIGSVRFHVDKMQIVGHVERDTLNPDAQPLGDATGRWISPDPLSEEYPDWTPYRFAFNNPLRYTDPTGLLEEDWIPDEDGNLIAEKGDNTETLAKFLNKTVEDVGSRFKIKGESIGTNYEFKEGQKVKLNNNMTRAIAESSKTEGLSIETDTYYNCHGAAKTIVKGLEINKETTKQKSSLFQSDTNDFSTDIGFKSSFSEVSSSKNAVFGKTVLSFGQEHSAVFYGTDSKGNEYYFSKNGFQKPAVFSKEALLQIYPTNSPPILLNYEPK